MEAWMSLRKCGEVVDYRPATLRSLIRSGKLRAVRFRGSGHFRVAKSDLEKLLLEVGASEREGQHAPHEEAS